MGITCNELQDISLSQSAANVNAGGKTAASNIVTALAIQFTLVFLTPRFQYTPIAVLSSIIMATVMGIVDYEAAISKACVKVEQDDTLFSKNHGFFFLEGQEVLFLS